MIVARFWYTLLGLATGIGAMSVALVAATDSHRRLSYTWTGFLASIWLILLSFALEDFNELSGTGPDRAFFAFAIDAIGSISYMFVAPLFYHTVLGARIGPHARLAYRLVAGVTITGVLLLAIESVRPVALVVLNALLFTVILYGIMLLAFQFRTIPERSLRRAITVFVILAAVFFPLMYLESVPWWGENPLGVLSHFALPSFYILLTVLSIPFAIGRLKRPAFYSGGCVTTHFSGEYGLSDRETQVADKLAKGMTNREIADVLFISPKTVENHLAHIFAKTGTHNRTQLVTLLFANQ